MKLAKITSMLLLCLQVGYAQDNTQEIGTTMLTLETLITHAADKFPTDKAQKMYVLVETDAEGVSTDARFFLEQGVRLLLKRLQPTDQIAIGTYGSDNQTILDFTEVSNTKTIFSGMKQLYAVEIIDNDGDGIDLAYQYARENYEVDFVNKVIMLRNDSTSSHRSIAKSRSSKKSAKSPKEQITASTKTKLGGAIALTALSILPEILDVIKN